MDGDKEIRAMAAIVEALGKLDDDDTVARVLRWASDRFKVSLQSKGGVPSGITTDQRGDAVQTATFKDIADLYDCANPSTDAERALVAGYWFQELQGQPDLDAYGINTILKHLGHGIDNITHALGELIDHDPRLVIQTRKSGTSKQARKKYKLTTEGIRRVKEMFAGRQAVRG